MDFHTNYNITNLFNSKDITITGDFQFKIHVFPVKEFLDNPHWNITYHLLTSNLSKKLFNDKIDVTNLQALKTIMFDLGAYSQFREFYTILMEQLPRCIIGFNLDLVHKEFLVDDHIITEEIWEYIVYLLKLSSGEKVTQPLTFATEEARKLYLAQKEAQDRIDRIRNQSHDNEGLMKAILSIIYVFPSLTIDYLFNQTMAQIQWLQKYAAGAVSYEVNAKAFAAGNMKKGSKLDFFIK